MQRGAEGYEPIGDPILFGVGVVVIRPFCASARTVPLIGRKFVDDGRLIGASCCDRLYVALVEAVYELMNCGHYVGLFSCSSRQRCQNGQGECEREFKQMPLLLSRSRG